MPLRPATEAQQRPARTGGRALAAALCAVLLGLPTASDAAEGLSLNPQLQPFLINFATFLLLIYPVKTWLLDPLYRVLVEREARTTGAVTRSQELQTESREVGGTIESRLREARAASQRARAAVLAEAEAEERHILDMAREESARKISALRDSLQHELEVARENLRGHGVPLAQEAASRILGRPL